jgi:hypothetical protein
VLIKTNAGPRQGRATSSEAYIHLPGREQCKAASTSPTNWEFAVWPAIHYILDEGSAQAARLAGRGKRRPYKFLPVMTNDFLPFTTNSIALPCDGCGQAATAEHIARRLQRLEWTTRYRPVHIHTLLLGAFSPLRNEDFLYASGGEYGAEFRGEAAQILDGVGISAAGKPRDAVHAEFQRAGFFLTHVLECPFEGDGNLDACAQGALKKRLAAVATRIRRSLKPKRVMAVTEELALVLDDILAMDLGCPVLLDQGKPFLLESPAGENAVVRLREALAAASPG